MQPDHLVHYILLGDPDTKTPTKEIVGYGTAPKGDRHSII